jgi:hypothetical protein
VLQNLEFDYLFRTNTSSYINIEVLQKYISQISHDEKKYLYSGIPINLIKSTTNEEIKFVSGAGILFNRNTLELLVREEAFFDHDEWEDVGIGKLLNKSKIYPTKGFREDIKGNIFKERVKLNAYHYRCRVDNHYGYPRFLETLVMKELDYRIKNQEGERRKVFYIYLFEFCKLVYLQNLTWNLYKFLKFCIKITLPKKIFESLKKIMSNHLKKFQLRYFKK